MHHAYNAYITKVLEAMVSSEMSLKQAKQICRQKLQFLEESYRGLSDAKLVAVTLKAS